MHSNWNEIEEREHNKVNQAWKKYEITFGCYTEKQLLNKTHRRNYIQTVLSNWFGAVEDSLGSQLHFQETANKISNAKSNDWGGRSAVLNSK